MANDRSGFIWDPAFCSRATSLHLNAAYDPFLRRNHRSTLPDNIWQAGIREVQANIAGKRYASRSVETFDSSQGHEIGAAIPINTPLFETGGISHVLEYGK
jgi:hypothetical protein